MKVLQINRTDISGGAARAAYRLHHALREYGINSQMLVNSSFSGDSTVHGPESIEGKALAMTRSYFGRLVKFVHKTDNPVIHSPALLPSRWPGRLNRSDADILHLHWIAGEMLSIADIGRLQKPIVWTLHDMWAFCGAEHYTTDHRWRDGYTRLNRPDTESGFDINLWTWRRKQRRWKGKMYFVTPSRWLADCVRNSALLAHQPVRVIPNALNTELWRPVEKSVARDLLGLPTDVPLVMFGAMGGTKDLRKGYDLLKEALKSLREDMVDLQLVIFGQLPPADPPDLGFPIHYTGHLHDDLSLRLYYSAADALVIPSRQDNLPNTGVEALACATPVVAFDVGGMADIVAHKHSGYLAQAFDTSDLARGLCWVLSDRCRHEDLCQASRQRAVECFSHPVVARQYSDLYQEVLEGMK